MKRILTILFSLIFAASWAQKLPDVQWETPYYEIIYSQQYEQPLLIMYRVCGDNGTVSRKGLNFHVEPGIKTSDNADYVNNIWDKGHMAPAASLNCEKGMMYESFSYMNCALQHEKLNRGVWKYLEDRERELSKRIGTMSDVFIEVDFDEVPKRVPGGAAIPKGFYKEISVGDLMECYWFRNEEPKSNKVIDYKCDCRN